MNESVPQTEPSDIGKYGYVRGFASRLCLVLERYYAIAGYEMQAPEPLEEAIEFFRVALGRGVNNPLGRYFDASCVNLGFVRKVLAENTEISHGLESREFCEFAISTLRTLLKTPKRVPATEILRVHDFFCTTELVIDPMQNLRSRSFVVSLAS